MIQIEIDHHSALKPSGLAAEWLVAIMLETAEACGISLRSSRFRIYAVDLAEHVPEEVIAAFRRARKEGSGFFPSIAEINRQIGPSADDAALLTWNALELAASSVGQYQSMQIDDPCAAAALLRIFGSWPAFCVEERGPEMMVKRQAYLAAYRDARRTLQRGAQSVRLAGLAETEGKYKRVGAVWSGRLTSAGTVEHVRDEPPREIRAALPGRGGDDGEEGKGSGVAGDGEQGYRGARKLGSGVRGTSRSEAGHSQEGGREEERDPGHDEAPSQDQVRQRPGRDRADPSGRRG